MSIGYVVIEYNQASKQPSIVDTEILDRDFAEDLKAQCERATNICGRRETYALASVVLDEPS